MEKIEGAYDVEAAFAAIEEELIASMIRNLKRHRDWEDEEGFHWSMWQAEQLQALERYKKSNSKKFQRRFEEINGSIRRILETARAQGGMEQEIAILEAIEKGWKAPKKLNKSVQTSAEFFKLNTRKLNTLIQATEKDFQKGETAILRRANDQYRRIIFNAQVYANTGAGTYESAVDMAARDFLAAGINCIEYKNGARHTMRDYATMAIRTAAKRAYLSGEGEKRQEWGISTVIINKRGNPCPKCLPFVGKVMIDDVWSGGKPSDGPYPLLSSAIAAGLYHPNCKDSHTTYFPGVTRSAGEKLKKSEMEAAKEDYMQDQKERHVKREVERYDRLVTFSLDSQNKKGYEARREEWKAREQEIREETRQLLYPENHDKLDVGIRSNYEDEILKIPEVHRRIINGGINEIEIIKEGNSRFDREKKKMYLRENFEKGELIHEMAHVLETEINLYRNSEFRKVLWNGLEDCSLGDILYKPNSFSEPIYTIENKKFVSEYQGRVYIEVGIFNEDKLNPFALGEYFSEGYKTYILNPELLREKDPRLYAYIKEMQSD